MRIKAESKTLVSRYAPSKYSSSTLTLLRRLVDVVIPNQEDYSIEGRTLRMRTATLTNYLGGVQKRQLAALLKRLEADGIVEFFRFEGDFIAYCLNLESLTGLEPISVINKRDKKLRNADRAAKAREQYAAERKSRRAADVQAFMREMKPLLFASVLHPARMTALA
jgi:hypothetical protein